MWITTMQVIGLVLLILEIWAVIVNARIWRQFDKSDKRRKYYILAWVIGIPFGIASVFMCYPTSVNHGQQYKTIGIPFLAAAFDENGADYVSPLTPILMGVNFTFWLLFPQLYIWVKWINIKRNQTLKDSIANQEDAPEQKTIR
jgi:hypothetical protein